LSAACGQSSAGPALAKQCSSSGPQPALPDGQQQCQGIVAWCLAVAGAGVTAGGERGDVQLHVVCGLGTTAGVSPAPRDAGRSTGSLNLTAASGE